MAYIKTVEEEDATGLLAKQYLASQSRSGGVAAIVKLHSLNPKALRASMLLYRTTTTSPDSSLPRTTREMLAVVVSRANDCFY